MTYDKNAPRPYRRNTADKFWSLVDKSAGPGECWPWTAVKGRTGYGQFKFEGKNWGAHRLAYILVNGAVPEGLVLDHLCRVRHCCNPTHLEPVTNAENVLRGEGLSACNARATHCLNDHEFTPENTRVVQGGQRQCATCARARQRERGRRRAELIKADPSLAPHGVVTTYSNWKCRCEPCKAKWSEYMAEYHQRRKRAIATRTLRAA